MGIMDSIKGALSGKSDDAAKAIDKAADVIDDKTGNKHSSHIEQGADKVKDVLEGLDDKA